jgi:hypothetical protein
LISFNYMIKKRDKNNESNKKEKVIMMTCTKRTSA